MLKFEVIGPTQLIAGPRVSLVPSIFLSC